MTWIKLVGMSKLRLFRTRSCPVGPDVRTAAVPAVMETRPPSDVDHVVPPPEQGPGRHGKTPRREELRASLDRAAAYT
jgi:hypothetical protein